MLWVTAELQRCDEESDDGKLRTAEEEAVLGVDFPPWYFSTHGLSRPATPEKDDKERYAVSFAIIKAVVVFIFCYFAAMFVQVLPLD